jgi:hypothetical protein
MGSRRSHRGVFLSGFRYPGVRVVFIRQSKVYYTFKGWGCWGEWGHAKGYTGGWRGVNGSL